MAHPWAAVPLVPHRDADHRTVMVDPEVERGPGVPNAVARELRDEEEDAVDQLGVDGRQLSGREHAGGGDGLGLGGELALSHRPPAGSP